MLGLKRAQSRSYVISPFSISGAKRWVVDFVGFLDMVDQEVKEAQVGRISIALHDTIWF